MVIAESVKVADTDAEEWLVRVVQRTRVRMGRIPNNGCSLVPYLHNQRFTKSMTVEEMRVLAGRAPSSKRRRLRAWIIYP